ANAPFESGGESLAIDGAFGLNFNRGNIAVSGQYTLREDLSRDIKPSNILLPTNVERVVLTDFGLARAVDDATLTCSGVIAGTPQYMSPEQAKGELIDHRSDLFSLGSVLYAMAAGRPPFRAETPYGIIRRIVETETTPLRQIDGAIPVWFERLIKRLHAKDPEHRIGTADEAAELMEACLSHVQNRDLAIPETLIRPTKRSRKWVVTVITMIVVLMLLIWLWRPPSMNALREIDRDEAMLVEVENEIDTLLAESESLERK
ncbi:MAG: serine/threonine-protein kinase, partial [Planctomycetota bacterium]